MRISDWSSDVCSSDLSRPDHDRRRFVLGVADDAVECRLRRHRDDAIDHAGVDFLPLFDAGVEIDEHVARAGGGFGLALNLHAVAARRDIRSEERRVGKECDSPCRYRWSPYTQKNK